LIGGEDNHFSWYIWRSSKWGQLEGSKAIGEILEKTAQTHDDLPRIFVDSIQNNHAKQLEEHIARGAEKILNQKF
jgi:hypothetical protein